VLLRLARATSDLDFHERAAAALAAQTPVARSHGVDAAPYALAVRDFSKRSSDVR
jgi:hypothetical protein